MGDIQTRPFSKNYSGLINQSVVAIGITVLSVTCHEVMKRMRRGKPQTGPTEGVGSRESWQFGYMYQGRSWARFPSPPSPNDWPLSWARQAFALPETKLLELRGIDATLYTRFLRGCFWFTLLHTFTTFPILFPIHVEFSEATVPSESMIRASIASLVGTAKGRSLLWIHITFLFWVTFSWMATLLWICSGFFQLQKLRLKLLIERLAIDDNKYHPHPLDDYAEFDASTSLCNRPTQGLRLRTIMVSNVPSSLREEKELKEYFEFHMSHQLQKPSLEMTSSVQPGFLNKLSKSLTFLFKRAKAMRDRLLSPIREVAKTDPTPETAQAALSRCNVPVIERVVITRKMTSLASLIERRQDILHLLERAHIQLAKNILLAAKEAIDRRRANLSFKSKQTPAAEIAKKQRAAALDLEQGAQEAEDVQKDQLIDSLQLFVEEFGLPVSLFQRCRMLLADGLWKRSNTFQVVQSSCIDRYQNSSQPRHKTIWEALSNLPRSSLDPYQPLINLSFLFRGKAVPAIDYYTTKLNILTSLLTESRSKPASDYDSVSTAFVTFADPADARRACKYLAVHPDNPLECVVTKAPIYHDLNWKNLMKSSFNAEFVKDWVVNLGVWVFTLFWLFPVSLLVGLVSIQNISLFWPSLKAYLDRHTWQEELMQSFFPTLLVALVALFIPFLLFFVAKKIHTFTTLSAMHDIILTRYYKFLIVNVLVFFCVGNAALQSILLSFRSSARAPDVLQVVANSFPTAGPFYVGWLIFTTATHGGFELALFGLPLILYPATSSHFTPRKRSTATRPRIFNFYYWLPNHLLVVHIMVLFAVLNPFVFPFGALYFFVQSGVIKNQLIHVYAKNYENNGTIILTRIVRYSLDGLLLAQGVFLAYMVVLKKSVNVGLAAFLILFTAVTKLGMTRMCRAQFEQNGIDEADVVCAGALHTDGLDDAQSTVRRERAGSNNDSTRPEPQGRKLSFMKTWRWPQWISFLYATVPHRPDHSKHKETGPFSQHCPPPDLISSSHDAEGISEVPRNLSPGELHLGNAPVQEDETRSSLADITSPVSKHPAPVPWDDESTLDLPYENPYYSRTLENVLWLPRDPFGILDLDDTIDLRISLCVDVAAGQLGSWLGLGETSSPREIPDGSTCPASMERSSAASLLVVDGTENIELPLAIAQRVNAREDNIEWTIRPRRPPNRRRFSATMLSNEIATPRRPPTSRKESLLQEDIIARGHERHSSVISSQHLASHQCQSPILEQKPFLQTHAQVLTATASKISRLSQPSHANLRNVTASQAIFNEVLAEEKAAMVDQIKMEEQDTQKALSSKSWLTAWMFRKQK